jgi:CubicO group peptidase (beta-lactamase class C family)
MMKYIIQHPYLLMIVLLVGMSLPSTTSTYLPPEQTTAEYAAVDDYMKAQMEAWRVPGAAVVVVKDGQVVHSAGYGKADSGGKNITPQTLFEIGSTTKSFTALAVMQLVEHEALDLDEPVVTYLPWFQTRYESLSDKITIRHLLNHTSGIPVETSYRLWTNPFGQSLKQRVEGLKDARLVNNPGSVYIYNNYNYMTLALVIEAVSNQSYAAYIQDHIFNPLSMTSSTLDFERDRDLGLADGHTWWFGYPMKSRYGNRPDMLGAGYLITNAEDMGCYLSALLEGGVYNGKRVLMDEGIAQMHQPPSLPSGDSPYGFGWVSYPEEHPHTGSIRIVNHNGSSVGFTSSVFLVPERGLGLAVFANTGMQQANSNLLPAWRMANEVKNMLLEGHPGSVSYEHNQFFRFWNGGHLILGVLVLAALGFEIYRWRSGGAPGSSWISLSVHILIALVFLLGLPIGLGLHRWLGAFQYMPDTVWWNLLMGVLVVGKAVISRL